MPKKSRTTRRSRRRRGVQSVPAKTKKQKIINMIGCSKKHKHSNSCKIKKDLGRGTECANCGPNCHCGPNCNCPHQCPGSCYLNRRKMIKRGGQGCGSCGCPTGGLSYEAMNKFGGSNNLNGAPVLIDGTNNGEYITIPGISQNGGSNFFKPASNIPGATVGSPWGASVKDWPTMNGKGGDRNYLSESSKVVTNNPQQQMTMSGSGYNKLSSMVGGYKKRRTQKGGGIIPQDLVNLGSNLTFGLKSAYNSLNGYAVPVNPMPYKDQLTHSSNYKKLFV